MGESERTAASEGELLAQAKAGDEEAFAHVFGRHVDLVAGRIRRVLPARITRKVSVVDIVQEVRITAFQRLGDFELRGDGSFRRWLMRIAELKVGAELKRYGQTAKRAARAEVTRGQRPTTGQFQARDRSPSEVAMVAEDRRFVRDALTLLPDDYRQILELVYVEQLNLREAGERLDRSADAARKLYGRALARFTEVTKRMRGQSHA
ncbi:MAG: RNA polymerase sigma factor [Planctomycetota bacterium]|jgi:RNA polymerase sigma-70 factor (ECF subfamily)